MSLNNIQLSGSVCKNLFSHSLVQVNESKLEKEELVQKKIESLGNNFKRVFFIVNDDSCQFLPDEEMEMLIKLLSACKLAMEDISLVNFHFHPLTYQMISETFEPKKILLFGVSTSQLQLPFAIPDFQLQAFNNQLYMAAPSLTELLNNKELKKNLWASLQKIFL